VRVPVVFKKNVLRTAKCHVIRQLIILGGPLDFDTSLIKRSKKYSIKVTSIKSHLALSVNSADLYLVR